MKRLFALLLTLGMLVSVFAGCGKTQNPPYEDSDNPTLDPNNPMFDPNDSSYDPDEDPDNWGEYNPDDNHETNSFDFASGLQFIPNYKNDSYSVKAYFMPEEYHDIDEYVLNIPATYQGKPVTAICDYAFSFSLYEANLIINIPDSVVSIGDYAFYDTTFDTINISKGVVSIGEYAFADAIFNKIEFSEGLKYIGDDAFNNCNVIELDFPSTLISIGNDAFSGCDYLKSVHFEEGIQKIGESAFAYCPYLNEINFPDSLQHIGKWVLLSTPFYKDDSNWENGCLYVGNHLVSIKDFNGRLEIKPGTISVADIWFKNYGKITAIIAPNTLKYMAPIFHSQYWPYSLTELIIPEETIVRFDRDFSLLYEDVIQVCNLLEQEGGLVYYGTTLRGDGNPSQAEFVIREGTTHIYDIVNSNMNIKTVTVKIPASVIEITPAALTEFDSDVQFVIDANNPRYAMVNNCIYDKQTKTVLWAGDGFTIPEDAKHIGDKACSVSQSAISELILPEGLETIGELAFWGCDGIDRVVIPDSVRKIETKAFGSCDLKDLVIGNGVITIGESAFSSNNFTEVEIPSNVTYVGKTAFAYCKTLETVKVNKGTYGIKYDAFEGSALKKVYYAGTVEECEQFGFPFGGRELELICAETSKEN